METQSAGPSPIDEGKVVGIDTPRSGGTTKKRNKSAEYADVLDAIRAQYRFARDGGGQLYVYGHGHYMAEDDVGGVLGPMVSRIMRQMGVDPYHEDDFLAKIHNTTLRHAPKLWEAPPRDQVNLLNGVVDLPTGNIRPHSEFWYSPVQIPIIYDPAAQCPIWDSFLQQLFPPTYFPFIHEVIGSLMTPTNFQQVCLWLKGEGSNGKSTFVRAVANFVGQDNYRTFRIAELDHGVFVAAQLAGRLLVADTDTKKVVLKSTDTFKKYISGEDIMAQHKHQQLFTYRPFGKMIFCGNHEIEAEDKSWGFRRRILTVPFTRTFSPGQVEQDDLLDRLKDPSELSGLLNKAILGWRSLQQSRKFTLPAEVSAATESTQARNSNFIQFQEENLQVGGEFHIAKSKLLDNYNKWLTKHSYPPVTGGDLGRIIKVLFPQPPQPTQQIKIQGEPVYFGFRLLVD